LLSLVEKLGWSASEDIITLAAEINEFNTESRYPDQKLEFHKKATKEFAKRYIDKGKDFLQWIEQNSQKG
jgi:HEPN domain-containing protein